MYLALIQAAVVGVLSASPLPGAQAVRTSIPANAVERKLSVVTLGDLTDGREYLVNGSKVGERFYYDTGEIAEERLYRDGVLHGVSRQFYKNGQVFAERPFKDGRPDGEFVYWDETGKQLGKSVLRDGNGILRECANDTFGTQDGTTPFVNGNIHGQKLAFCSLNDKGLRGREVTEFRRGMKNGWQVKFRDSGQMYSSAYYHQDQLHGVQRQFEDQAAMAENYPKYFIHGKEVDRDEFEDAATSDAMLQISLKRERPGAK